MNVIFDVARYNVIATIQSDLKKQEVIQNV